MPSRPGAKKLVAYFIVLLVASPLALTATAGSAAAASSGFSGLGGLPAPTGYVSPNGTVVNLAMNGLIGWESFNQQDNAFVDQLTAEDINPHPSTYTVVVLVHQFVTAEETVNTVVNNTTISNQVPYDAQNTWQNYSFAVPARSWGSFAFTVPTATSAMDLVVTVDGVRYTLMHHTLPSLLPFGLLSIGAVQLIVLGVLLIAGLMTAVLIPVAKRVQSKGQRWAPKPRLAIWVPITVLTIGALLTQFYAELDFVLNAWIYVIIPTAFAIPMFFWLLRFFNLADVREMLKAVDPEKSLDLKFVRWERLFAEDGEDLIMVWETWRGWLYSLLGHPIKVTRAKSAANIVEGPPFAGQVLYEEVKRRPQGTGSAFKLVGARPFEPGYLYFIDSDRAVDVTHPHFTLWRMEDSATDTTALDGSPRKTTIKVRRFHPHIENGRATLHLAGIHWQHVVAVALEWVRAERLARALEIEGLKNTVLRREIETRANALAETLMDAFTRMMGRPNRIMTPEEAREEIASWGSTFDPLLRRTRGERKDGK